MSFSVPTDAVISRPYWGATLRVNYPWGEPTSPGGSAAAVWGLAIPVMFFIDTMFTAREGEGGGVFGINDIFSQWSRDDYDYYDDEEEDDYNDVDSWEEQQSWALSWVEELLGWQGVNGRSCVQRFICELQHRSIGQYSVLGELMAVMFRFADTESTNSSIQPYLEAKQKGESVKDWEACAAFYPSCPQSPFALFGAKANRTTLH